MHQRIAGGQRFKLVRRGDKRLPGDGRQLLSHAYRVFRMGVKPGAHRGAPQCQLRQVRQAVVDMAQIVLEHRYPAGDLLAESQRRGILQMGSANFNDIGERLRFIIECLLEHVQLWNQLLPQGNQRRHMHRRREDVVGTLAFVNVIVGVDFALHAAHAAEQLAATVCQHLVHVHIALGAGAGLPDSEGELVGMFARQHFIGGIDNGGGFFCRQQA